MQIKQLVLALMLLLLCSMGLTPKAQAATYRTISAGNWMNPEIWEDEVVPTEQNLGANDKIYIRHNIVLSQTLTAKANKLQLHVGGNGNPVVLATEKDFIIQSSIDIYIYEYSSLIIGKNARLTDPGFNYCGEDPLNKKSLFRVEGSSGDPSLTIHPWGKFHVYGDFKVENKFIVQIMPMGIFRIEGGFFAGNTANIKISGAGAYVGCDMFMDNSAEVELDVGKLTVGGDLLFKNSATITLIGSEIFVYGTVCSEGGSGAIVNLIGDINQPSTVTALHVCNEIDLRYLESQVILPVELLSFQGQIIQGEIVLHWQTASETNNHYYTIERSRDMQTWDILGRLEGAGNSNQLLSYSFADRLPLQGVSYYRLKQTDFDGKYEYFSPLVMEVDPGAALFDFVVEKQPGLWSIIVADPEPFLCEVYTLSGRKLFSDRGSHYLSFPAPGQAVIIRLVSGHRQQRSRIVM